MKRKISIEESRQIQLDIMDKIDDFCKKNNIRYTLAYGTLLGAVRHHGFIPWDDDIDLQLPRPDYDRFVASFEGVYPNLKIQIPETDETYNRFFGKVYDDRTVIMESLIKTGVYIDIFPVDGVPSKDDMPAYAAELENLRNVLGKVTKFYKFQKPKIYLYIKYLLKKILYPSRKNVLNLVDEFVHKYPFETTMQVGSPSSPYILKECMNPEIFKSYKKYVFEGREYMGISNYDEYLAHYYKNYMQLPPEEKRVSHHEFYAYWKD